MARRLAAVGEGPMRKITILVACSSPDRRKRWEQRLQEAFAICEVGEQKALKQVMGYLRPDVLVLDLSLSGLGGIRGLPDIQRLSPSTKIIALAARLDEKEGVKALEAGARGYDTRDVEPAQLRKAAETVEKGEVWVQRRLVGALLAAFIPAQRRHNDHGIPPDARLLALTPRERQVAEQITRGASNKEIARELNISERTVKGHLTEMFRDLNVSDRLQLGLLLNGRGVELRRLDDSRSTMSRRGRAAGSPPSTAASA